MPYEICVVQDDSAVAFAGDIFRMTPYYHVITDKMAITWRREVMNRSQLCVSLMNCNKCPNPWEVEGWSPVSSARIDGPLLVLDPSLSPNPFWHMQHIFT